MTLAHLGEDRARGLVGGGNGDLDHALTAAAVTARLGADATRGLGADDAAARLVEHGPNELERGEGVSRRARWNATGRRVKRVGGGDLVHLDAGTRVPADGRLVEARAWRSRRSRASRSRSKRACG